jgi:uncharacterized protein
MIFIPPFLVGLLTSLHCIGMCGGLVACYAVQRGSAGVLAGMTSHLFYNGGRLFSYTVLGGIAGLAGQFVGTFRPMAGPWFSIVAGVAMAVIGFFSLDIVPGWFRTEPAGTSWLRRFHLRSVADLLRTRSREGAFYIGLLTSFLPCGLLYAMVVKAAETGSASSGAFTMLAFGAGTVPALLLTGMATTFLSVRLRLYATRVAALVVVVMGALLVIRAIAKLGV